MSYSVEHDLRAPLPKDWDLRRLKEVTDIIPSNVDKLTVEGEAAVRLCNYVDTYKNEKITSKIEFMAATATAAQIDRLSLRAGDITITKDSESPWDIAVPALVAEDIEGLVCGYHLSKISADRSRMDGGFLAWALRSKPVNVQFSLAAQGITRYGLGSSALADGFVPCPPVCKQIAIASYLDAETARIDALIGEKRALVAALDELHGVTVTQAVTRGLNPNVLTKKCNLDWLSEIPCHWQAVAIKRLVASMTYGGSSATEDEGPVRVLTMAHISRGEVSNDSSQFWPAVDEDLLLERNDLLFNRTNSPALVGKVGIFRGSREDMISFASYLVRLRVSDQHDPRWLNFALNCDQFIAFARGHALISLNQANLNSSKFGRFLIAVPPLAEQTDIADFLDSELVKIEALKRHVKAEIDLLVNLRASTITDAVLGRIDVRPT